MNPSLEEMMNSLEENIKRKTQQRDKYQEFAELVETEGFHDASVKLIEIASGESKQLGVLKEIAEDLRKIVHE